MSCVDLGPVVARVAGWPIETVAELHSASLTARLDQWLQAEQSIRAQAAAVSEILYAVVPTISDAATRAKALLLRRHVHNSTSPLPDCLVTAVSAAVADRPAVELIRRESRARTALAARRRELETAYASSLATEQAELCRIAEQPAFRKALFLASPVAFDAVMRAERDASRLDRKLVATLHSYVMRSVGRATPNGLWAGVAVEASCHPTKAATPPVQVTPDTARALFTVDLNPFSRALRALACQKPWPMMPLRLHPKLMRGAAAARDVHGCLGRESDRSQMLDATLVTQLRTLFDALPTRLLEEVRDHLHACSNGWSVEQAEDAVLRLLRIGLLRTAVEFPGTYADAWTALDGLVSRVPAAERPHWARAVRRLKSICVELTGDCDAITLDELRTAAATVRDCVNVLLFRYGAPPVREDTHVLTVDMHAPFQFSLSPDLRTQMVHSLRDYWDFDWYGMGELGAAIDRRRFFGNFRPHKEVPLQDFVRRREGLRAECADPTGLSVSTHAGVTAACWEDLLSTTGDSTLRPEVESRFQRWYEELSGVHDDERHRLQWRWQGRPTTPLPPGSALLRFGRAAQGCEIRIGAMVSDPFLFYSRFAPLLTGGTDRQDPCTAWWHRSLRGLGPLSRHLYFADLPVRGATNPNAASRPDVSHWLIDPLDPADAVVPNVLISVDDTGLPSFRLAGCRSLFMPLLRSAVLLDGTDPFTECLHDVSALQGRPSLMAPLPRFAAERERWHHLPRLYLDESTVVSARRWTPPTGTVAELARGPGLDAFISWRRFVRHARLPRYIYARYGPHRTETLLSTDSVLAIEQLCRALAAHGGTPLFQEAFPCPGESWFRDAAGRHYVGEFAVAWQADATYWRQRLAEPAAARTILDTQLRNDNEGDTHLSARDGSARPSPSPALPGRLAAPSRRGDGAAGS
ncbi:lantibiotic dehydratase [Actinocorallia populi]|uniref:lantibiotic dehydratase n=1 Tax=Actinocorallia populi TaxID=2079200 RepID=UPI001300324E|nr:lantibiotic dehydratase [Actinocorallia populi]